MAAKRPTISKRKSASWDQGMLLEVRFPNGVTCIIDVEEIHGAARVQVRNIESADGKPDHSLVTVTRRAPIDPAVQQLIVDAVKAEELPERERKPAVFFDGVQPPNPARGASLSEVSDSDDENGP